MFLVLLNVADTIFFLMLPGLARVGMCCRVLLVLSGVTGGFSGYKVFSECCCCVGLSLLLLRATGIW